MSFVKINFKVSCADRKAYETWYLPVCPKSISLSAYLCVCLSKGKLYGIFLWAEFNCLKTAEPLRGDSLFSSTKSPGVPDTHLFDLEEKTGWVDLAATQWFWNWDLWIGNAAPQSLGHWVRPFVFWKLFSKSIH